MMLFNRVVVVEERLKAGKWLPTSCQDDQKFHAFLCLSATKGREILRSRESLSNCNANLLRPSGDRKASRARSSVLVGYHGFCEATEWVVMLRQLSLILTGRVRRAASAIYTNTSRRIRSYDGRLLVGTSNRVLFMNQRCQT